MERIVVILTVVASTWMGYRLTEYVFRHNLTILVEPDKGGRMGGEVAGRRAQLATALLLALTST